MVKCQVLYDRTRSDIFLNLCDQEVMLTGSDVPTLFVIEVIIVGVALDVIIGRRSGPMNTNFNVVVIECHERDGTLGVLHKRRTEEGKNTIERSHLDVFRSHSWKHSGRTYRWQSFP